LIPLAHKHMTAHFPGLVHKSSFKIGASFMDQRTPIPLLVKWCGHVSKMPTLTGEQHYYKERYDLEHYTYFCTFSFDHCVFCSSSIYEFWLPFGIFKLFLHNIFILSSYLHDTEYAIWIILVILTKVDGLDLFPNVR
jgi:hypothetical protein